MGRTTGEVGRGAKKQRGEGTKGVCDGAADPLANAADRWLHELYDSEDERRKEAERRGRARRPYRSPRYAVPFLHHTCLGANEGEQATNVQRNCICNWGTVPNISPRMMGNRVRVGGGSAG